MLIKGVIRFTRLEIEAINASKEYIDENFHKSVNADDLSIKFKLPLKKLQVGFQRHTGYTIHNYILKIRVEYSKVLLSNLEEPIKLIHKKIGFNSRSHFSQFFKRQTGVTPSEYRGQFFL